MRVLAQRVTRASVLVDDEILGRIDRGFVLLVGVTHDDSLEDAFALAGKVAHLRVFDDEAGQLNRSLLDLETETPGSVAVLVVSQFTLYADARKGRRPSFVRSAPREIAQPLVDHLGACLRNLGLRVESGRFGAEMAVELVNDGPVTIWLDSLELRG